MSYYSTNAIAIEESRAKELIAGLALAGGVSAESVTNYLKVAGHEFGEQAVTAAMRKYSSRPCGFLDAAHAAAYALGEINFGDNVETLRAAADQSAALTAYSTNSFSGLLRETAQIGLFDAWQAATARFAPAKLARLIPAENFKETFAISYSDDELLERVPISGEVKNMMIDGERFIVKAQDFAKTLMVTREDLINGATTVLVQYATNIGRMAARTIESEMMRLLVNAPADFFITADTAARRKNALTANPLSQENLGKAAAALRRQVSAGKMPLSYEPNVLLVGDEDAALAQQLTSPTGPFPGITVVVSQWLHSEWIRDVTVSPTDWYLLSVSPLGAPLLLSFLHGVDRPTVTTASAKLQFLAMAMQVVLPFGVAHADPRAIVRSEG